MKPQRLYLLILLMAGMACLCPVSMPPGLTPAATEAPPAASPGAGVLPTTPPEPTVISPYQASGVVVDSGHGLSFYDRQGQGWIIDMPLQGATYSSPANVHLAGNYLAGLPAVPIIYYSMEKNESLMLRNADGQVTPLVGASGFTAMAGAPGLPAFAYATMDFQGNTTYSYLYTGTLASLPAEPALTNADDTEGWAIKPLALKAENYQPAGVWYTTFPWGIGGDIVFEPRKGLYYLDLTTGTTTEILGKDMNPSSLSFDQTWAAYASETFGSGPMTLRNLQTGASVTFPLLPAADQRGAGDGVISPGNQYVAWMEGSGWQMAEAPNFHATVRVGDMNGNVVAEFPDSTLAGVSGLSKVGYVEPVGWCDDQTLILQVRGEVWDQVMLIRASIPDKALSYLASGAFIAFLYP